MHGDAMDLVRTSSRQASAKLKFLRLALGAGGSAPGVIPTAEMISLSNDMFADSKPDLVWQIESDGIEKNHARIVMNLIMLAVQAAPRGGSVTIRKTGDDANYALVSEGPKVRLDASVAKAIAGKVPEDGFDGRSIQPLYASLLAKDVGGAVAATAEDEAITFTANFPA